MKKLLFLIVLLGLLPCESKASPFLVCDPQAEVEFYVITGLPSPLDGSHIAAEPDGSIRMDFGNVPVGGPYDIQVSACNLWGCSDGSPFVFSRPSTRHGPNNTRLTN
jgi:hypothetical protein